MECHQLCTPITNAHNAIAIVAKLTLVPSNPSKLTAQDFISENVLHDAVRADDIETVKYLVKQGVNINEQDEYGYTPLHIAVRLHQFNITSYLIDNNANVNTIDEYEDTPLIDATRNNDTNLSKIP